MPETEYVFSIDATPSELEYLFNPSRSLVETVGLTPKANAEKYVEVLGEMLAGDLPIDDPRVVDAPGAVIPLDCEEAAQLIDDEYGVADDHEPIDCSALGS